MYTGNLINELISTVERAEQRIEQARYDEQQLDRFYMLANPEFTQHQPLLGVA